MRKKIVGLCLCMLMIGLPLSMMYTTNNNHTSVIANDTHESEGCGCESPDLTRKQPQLIDLISENDSLLSQKPTIREDLPAYFSWRDTNGTDWTTPAKDQGNCGSCWDFAAIGALESIIQIREEYAALDLDLSEQYVLSCLHSAGSCKGGAAFSVYRLIKSNTSQGNYCNGIIP
jgi:C1A family cysteine protease